MPSRSPSPRPQTTRGETSSPASSSSQSAHPPPPMFSIFERFAHITRNARETAIEVLSNPLVKPLIPLVPKEVVRQVFGNAEDADGGGDGSFGLIGRPLNPDNEKRLREISKSVDLVAKEYETAGQYLTFLAKEVILGRYGKPDEFEQDLARNRASSAGNAHASDHHLPGKTRSHPDMLLPEHIADVRLVDLVDKEAFVVVPAPGEGLPLPEGSLQPPTIAPADPFNSPLLSTAAADTDATSHPLSVVPSDFVRQTLTSPNPPKYSSRNLCRSRLGPISPEEFLSPDVFMDAQGKMILSEHEFRRVVFERGLEHDMRETGWSFLLGVAKWDSTEKERMEEWEKKKDRYYELKNRWVDLLKSHPPDGPDDSEFFDGPSTAGPAGDVTEGKGKAPADVVDQAPGDERLVSLDGSEESTKMLVDRLRERKWRIEKDTVRTDRTIPLFSGENPNMTFTFTPPVVRRPSPSPFVAVVPPSESTSQASPPPEQTGVASTASPTSPDWAPSLRVLRDVLMTYCAWNGQEMGYVQGMNEWASVCVGMCGEGGEVAAYELLSAVLSLRLSTFSRTSSSISSDLNLLSSLLRVYDPQLYVHLRDNDGLNMFCCFRWLLVWFKREVEWAGVGGLWEVFLSAHLHTQYYLFFALTLLTTEPFRSQLMSAEGFDGVLKACNQVGEFVQTYKGGLEALLAETELVFYKFMWKLDRLCHMHIPHHVEMAKQNVSTLPLTAASETPASPTASGADAHDSNIPAARSETSREDHDRKSKGKEALPYAYRWLLNLKAEIEPGLGWAFESREWRVGSSGWELTVVQKVD